MKQTILITGGTSGIGAALAEHYARDNTLFVTGSRPASAMSPIANYIEADQRNPLEAAQSITSALSAAKVARLDLAVLNAGIGFWRAPADETRDEIRSTLDVNLSATIAITHALFPLLSASRGRLILIGSTSYKGQAMLASYAASKAALDGFARALRSEWQNRVTVQVIHPGPTATAMHGKAGLDTGKMAALFASSQSSARMIASAIQSGRLRTTLGIGHRLVHAATGWMR